MNISVQGPLSHTPHQTRRDESLVCNSCRMNFDAFRRRPLSLQCFHSYCEPCVTGMTLGKHGKKITCVQCKKTTKLDKSRNGNILPVNYTILEMVSVNSRSVPGPVTVTGQCDNPGLVRSAFEQVTIIPVRDTSHQIPCKENRAPSQTTPPTGRSNCQYDDRMTSPSMSNQCSGTTSISIGDLHPKSNFTKPEKSFPASEFANVHASTTCVAVTTSSNGCSPCPPNSQPQAPSVGPIVVSNLAPTVTSLTVKTPGSASHPASANPPCQPSAAIDLCCQCRVNPAAVTVTSAAQMSSQKLCAICYSLVQSKAEEELVVPTRNPVQPCRGTANQTSTSDGPSTTVIKISDENPIKSHSPACVLPPKKCEPPSCQLPIPNDDGSHRGSIHVDGIKGTSAFQKPIKVKDKLMSLEERPTIMEGVSKEECPCKQPQTKLAYQACSKFDLGSIRRNERPPIVKSVAECCPIREDAEADASEDVANDAEYRPLPFNPGFIDSAVGPSLESLQPEPTTSDQLYPPLSNSMAPSCPYNEKQPLEYQPPAPQYPLLPGAPPKYEEVVGQQPPQRGNSSTVRLVLSFGKYGEMATQPGAFRSPGRVNVSRSGVVVVSDSAHKTVQAFSPYGECLALIRVAGDVVGGSSCYDNNKLAVGTNAGVQIYELNGILKKSIPVGQVINTVGTYSSGFIAVQPKTLYIFRGPNETLFRTLRGRSKPGPNCKPIPFDCISDAAVNSQKDIVVLDAGAESGHGSIFVLSEDGFLKSCIVPGREPCGVLRQPSALAVDRDHNIIVSDSANRRILLFGANGRFHRQLLASGQLGGQIGSEMSVYPVGLDIAEDGRLFVVARGDKHAEVRIFTYH